MIAMTFVTSDRPLPSNLILQSYKIYTDLKNGLESGSDKRQVVDALTSQVAISDQQAEHPRDGVRGGGEDGRRCR